MKAWQWLSIGILIGAVWVGSLWGAYEGGRTSAAPRQAAYSYDFGGEQLNNLEAATTDFGIEQINHPGEIAVPVAQTGETPIEKAAPTYPTDSTGGRLTDNVLVGQTGTSHLDRATDISGGAYPLATPTYPADSTVTGFTDYVPRSRTVSPVATPTP